LEDTGLGPKKYQISSVICNTLSGKHEISTQHPLQYFGRSVLSCANRQQQHALVSTKKKHAQAKGGKKEKIICRNNRAV